MKRLTFLIVLFGSIVLLSGCMNRPIKDADKPLLVTVADLAEYGITYDNLEKSEIYRRVVYLDFSKEVEYEYDSPTDVEGIDLLYVSVTVGFERSVSEARKNYKIDLGAYQIGTKIGGVKVDADNDFFKWGDESFFGFLRNESNIVGNLFVCRSGKKIYSIIISGIYFSDPDLWAELLLPRLQYLKSYDG